MVLTSFSWGQVSFPPQLEFEPNNLRFKSLEIKEIVQYDLNYKTKDSINYYPDSTKYFQPDFILEYDSIGKLISMKYNFLKILSPPVIIEMDSNWVVPVKTKTISDSTKPCNCTENAYTYEGGDVFIHTMYPNTHSLSNCLPYNEFKFDVSNYNSLTVVNKFDNENRLIKTDYLNKGQSIYSRSYVYSLICGEAYSCILLTKVIETVNTIPYKEINIQYHI